jgi:CheY-like chemotaxis protein
MYEILIVDDEDVVDLFSQMFSSEVRSGQYRLHFAISGEQGLEVLHAQPGIDLVISDIKMTGMDGHEFASRVNALSGSPAIMMHSAFGDKINYRKAMAAGADDFVEKTAGMKEIKSSVAQLLSRRESTHHNLEVLFVSDQSTGAGRIAAELDRVPGISLTVVHEGQDLIEELPITDVIIACDKAGSVSGYELVMAYKARYPRLPVVLYANDDRLMNLYTMKIEMIAIGEDESALRIGSFVRSLLSQ